MKINKALERHHKAIARAEAVELAIIFLSTAACAAVFLGFGLISALIGA